MRTSHALKGLALAVLATLGAAGCRDFSEQTYCAAHPELCQMQVREVAPAESFLQGGPEVWVRGAAFDPDTRVVVGGVEVGTEVVDSSKLRFVAPAHEAGVVDLVLKSAHQTVTVPGAFTYRPFPQPQLDTVTPARGSTQGGTPLTLLGHGFAAPVTVLVGGVACTDVKWVDASRITARAPARSAGPQDVQVVTPYGTSRAAGAYTSVEPWAEMNQGLEGAAVLSVSVHPADGAVVLAGTRGGGLFRSADRGRTWARVPGLDAVTDVHALAHDAASGTSWAATAQGVFRGTDAGTRWTAWNTGLPVSDVTALAVRSDGTVFVGPAAPYSDSLYQLDLGASAWKRGPITPYYIKRGLAIGAASIYLDTGNDWGLVRGAFSPYWENVADRSLGINAFAVVPGLPDTVYVGTRDGLYSLNPDTKTRALLFTESPVTAVRVDPAAPDTLYLGTSKGLRVSLDAGATWTPGPGGPEVKLSALDVAPDGTVHAGTDAQGVLSGGPDGPLAPRGTGLTAADVLSLAVDATTPERLYAVTANGFFRSGDGASTWSAVPGGEVPSPRAVWADPTRAGIAYVAAAGGLYRTRDGGATWAPTGLMREVVRDVALATSAPGTLYAATNSGVWRSDDSGDTWSPALGPPSGEPPVRLAVSPHDAERLFMDDGLHVYLHASGTWTELGQAEGERLAMTVSPVDDRLYLQTRGSLLQVSGAAGLESLYTASGVVGTAQALGFSARGTLYAGNGAGGLARYTPGATPDTIWTRLSSIPAAVPILQVVAAPSAPDVVYVGTRGRGVLKSTIGGL